ncbi:MAG: hypothetical protein WCV81_01250 [Microgenomates group bacterium]|jgi:hypothetical protein
MKEGEKLASLGTIGFIVISLGIIAGFTQKEIEASPTTSSSDYLDPKSYKIRPDSPKEIIRKTRSTEPFKEREVNPNNFLTKYPRSLY